MGIKASLALIVATAATCIAQDTAAGADFKTVKAKDGKAIILLSGEIEQSDTQKLQDTIRAANTAKLIVSSVRLNSPGGLLLEGFKLAKAIQYGRIATAVASGATCASACFLIFAAGAEKFANYNGRIGVHGASDPNGAEADGATIGMAKAAREFGVPPGIIGKMVVTAPQDMVWLTVPDLQSMGATMVGKPQQVSDNRPMTLTPPQQQVAPLQDAQAPPANPKLTWKDLVASFEKISSEQNNGTPNYFRVCQPELKTCNTGVTFKNKDGSDSMLKTTTDLDGKVVLREMCFFNTFADVRTCVDWDTAKSHRDMKDGKGSWVSVE